MDGGNHVPAIITLPSRKLCISDILSMAARFPESTASYKSISKTAVAWKPKDSRKSKMLVRVDFRDHIGIISV